MECASFIQINECNCTQHYLPRPKYIRMCHVTESQCYERTFYNITRNIYEKEHYNEYKECSCLPLCNEIQYDLNVIAIDDLMENSNSSM